MRFSPLVLLISMMLAPVGATAQSDTEPDRPNILLLVGDDIGFGDLGISGSVTQTPKAEP